MKQENQKQKKSLNDRERSEESAAEALRESEERYRNLLDLSPDPIVILQDKKFSFVNQAFVDLFGYTREDLDGGMTYLDVVKEEDREGARSRYEKRLAGDRSPVIFRLDVIAKNGDLIPCESASTQIDYKGRPADMAILRNITEREEADHAIRESEERYRQLVDFCPDPIATAQDERIKFGNRAFFDLFGYSQEDLDAGLPLLEFVHQKDWKMVRQRYMDRIVEKPLPSSSRRISVIAKDGAIIPCGVTGTTIQVEGRPANMMVLRNLTEQLKSEEALQESEARYRVLFEQAADSVVLIDPETQTFLEFNDKIHQDLGYSAEEFKRLTITDVEALESPDEISVHIEEILAAGGGVFETKLRKKDGEIRDYLLNVRAVQLRGKAFISCICRDISGQKRAESALRESERYNRMLFDNSPIGLGLCDMNGKMVDVNSALARIVGYSVEEMLKLTYWEMTPDKYAEDEQVQLESLRNTGRYGPYEKELIHKDGHPVPIRASGLIFEKDGEPFIWSCAEDITEQRENEKILSKHRDHLEDLVGERTEQILKLEAEKSMMERLAVHGRVAAGIAHEINNPIASIKSSFLLIKDFVPTDHQYFHYVGRIDREIDRVADIVNQMFQLYNSKAQKPENIDLEFLFSDIPLMLEEIIKSTGVRITHSIDSDIPSMRLPEGNLRQILSNLLTNAVQATSPGGQVCMSAHSGESKNMLIIKVIDHGLGIPPHVITKIFDPFFTTKDGSTQGGMGLGLSVSQSLAKAMGGDISVESGKETGTIFQLSLPF